jgi:hypothetical protein
MEKDLLKLKKATGLKNDSDKENFEAELETDNTNFKDGVFYFSNFSKEDFTTT